MKIYLVEGGDGVELKDLIIEVTVKVSGGLIVMAGFIGMLWLFRHALERTAQQGLGL